ncbi:uncharacterized protein LOC120112244 [Phoenix dactylifera]|uniref:Uncharacterized protein LOC120112244 n=1 Tax=Phoenix dactylifera TaxID=42345 RepID=A0A8B9AUJ8_PHODC|nr:uncharacterized protein LOC120112244 [Phoenix dactylifera]
MVVDRAVLQAGEVSSSLDLYPLGTARDIWGTHCAVLAPRFVFASWVPPPPGYLNVSFDGSVALEGRSSGVGFIIRDHFGRLVVAGGRYTPGLTVVGAELQAAWEGVSYARRVLGARRVHLEGDSSIVIDWIQGADRYGDGHPLIRETRRMALEMDDFEAVHVFRKANSVADWVASYVARHSGDFCWTSTAGLPPPLYFLLSSDMARCTHVRVI